MVKKRFVIKKGRIIVTRRGSFVLKLAEKIYRDLKPLSKRICLAGSIRRKEKNPVDIDIVLIPKDKKKISEFLARKGKYLQGGDKRVAFKIQGVKVEVYFAEAGSWGATLMAYTGPSGSEIGLRKIARDRGFILNQYGLFKRDTGRFIAGKTEKSIYDALGKKIKPPELR